MTKEKEEPKAVEVYSSTIASQAYIAESMLKSTGLTVYTENALINEIPGINTGITLLVPTEEEEQALDLLLEGGFIKERERKELAMSPQEERRLFARKMGRVVLWIFIILLLLAGYSYFFAT